MSRCTAPLEGWFASHPNDNGRVPVVFSLHAGDPTRPVDVPCGKCPGCIQDKSEAWAVRCYHESTLHERNCFATFTYRDPCPPTVLKAHLQQLFKRLRNDGHQFRYFAVGEYGGRTGRPHYHVIFFGQDWREGSIRTAMGPRQDVEYYVSRYLSDTWELGNVLIAPAEADAIFYTAGYQLKALGQGFHMFSKRPALGHNWVSKFFDELVANGFCTIEGQKHPVPPAYLRSRHFAIEFDALRCKRAEHLRQVEPGQRGKARVTARGRETNMIAAAAAAHGMI